MLLIYVGGASHGGEGGLNSQQNAIPNPYGKLIEPATLGSPGGTMAYGWGGGPGGKCQVCPNTDR